MIRCGHCHELHRDVAAVRECAESAEAEAEARAESALVDAYEARQEAIAAERQELWD